MIKWLLLIAGAGALYLWIKGKKQTKLNSDEAAKIKAERNKVVEPEVIVQCRHCSVHLPKPEAIRREDRYYCSQEHLDSLDDQGWLGSAAWRISPNQDIRPEGVAPDLVVIHHISLPPGSFADRNSTLRRTRSQNRLPRHSTVLRISHWPPIRSGISAE